MAALFPTVQSLWIYPLKSGKGLSLEWSGVTRKGLQHDRLWMLVDKRTGEQFTQRDRGGEKLATVSTFLEKRTPQGEQSAVFSAPDMKDIWVRNPNLGGAVEVDVKLHGNTLLALDAGSDAEERFSEFLGYDVQLVRFPDDYKRDLNPAFYQPMDETAYADGGPVLVTGTASLDSLQPLFKAGANIDMRRFRPNIVIDGLAAWEEDVALTLRIGDAILEITKPCDRCPMPNVNQDTGERGAEPGKTLGKMRLGQGGGLGPKFFFGQNAAIRRPGIIRVGDRVEIIETKPMHPALEKCAVRYGVS